MIKIAIVGSRYMSDYGKEVINKLLITNYELRIKNLEIVTIKVMGCNGEVIRKCREFSLKCKIFEGENFQKLNEEVANYADVLVIIEGGEKSGTILLADKFVEKSKNVYCVPGRITDKGSYATNWLIKQGAIPLVDLDDLTEVLQ
ncbi:MAG: DNA-processing protein DprA [Candidatus Shapirobacteria bacterium]|jgi:predicted Rossmann fold nucleotide-binding protein DprA/Smf involved in DNA uptake